MASENTNESQCTPSPHDTTTPTLKRSQAIMSSHEVSFLKEIYENDPTECDVFLRAMPTQPLQDLLIREIQNVSFAKYILKEPRMNNPFMAQKMLQTALTMNGPREIIQILAKMIKETAGLNRQIEFAILNTDLETVQLLLQEFYEDKVVQEEDNDKFLRAAIRTEKLEMIDFFLDCPKLSRDLLLLAAESQNISIVNRILKHPLACPNDVIQYAMQNEDILEILMGHQRIHKQTLFLECIRTGQDVSVIKRLLESNLDISRDFQLALRTAAQYGQSTLFARLMKEPACNPAVDNSQCLRMACLYGHTDIVRTLLLDGRSCLSVFCNEPLNNACRNNHLEIVQLLLEYEVDPNLTDETMSPIQQATFYDNTSIVHALLKDIRLDPMDCIVTASNHGNIDMVSMFLQHPNQCKEYLICAIEEAARKGHANIVNLLQKYVIVNLRSLRLAVRNCHLFVVQTLLMQTDLNVMDVYQEATEDSTIEIIECLTLHPSFHLVNISAKSLENIVNRNCVSILHIIFKNHSSYTSLLLCMKRAIELEDIDMLEMLFPQYQKSPENETDDCWNPMTFAIEKRRRNCVDFFWNRVQPEGSLEDLFVSMVSIKHMTKIEALLKNPTLNAAKVREKGIPLAIAMQSISMVQLFFENPIFHGIPLDHQHLVLACTWGHLKIVEYLISIGHDVSVDNNFCIVQASQYGHVQLVQFLLTQSRVDPAAQQSRALVVAAKQGNRSIVELLLEDGRVDANADSCATLQFAKQWDWQDLYEILGQSDSD